MGRVPWQVVPQTLPHELPVGREPVPPPHRCTHRTTTVRTAGQDPSKDDTVLPNSTFIEAKFTHNMVNMITYDRIIFRKFWPRLLE